TVSAARVRVAIDPDLFPPAITVKMLDAGGVDVALQPAPEQAEPDRAFSPESLALPFELMLTELRLADFRLLNAAGDVLLEIDRAALAGRWHESITLTRLGVESPLGAVRGYAALSLSRPYAADATLEVRHALRVGADSIPLAMDAA